MIYTKFKCAQQNYVCEYMPVRVSVCVSGEVTVVHQNDFLNAVLKIHHWNVLLHVRMTCASKCHACHMLVRVWTVWYVMEHVGP